MLWTISPFSSKSESNFSKASICLLVKIRLNVRKAKDTYYVKLKLNFLDVGASGCCRIFLSMVSMFSSVILTIANDVDIYSSSIRFYSLYCLFFSAASCSIYSGVLLTSCSSFSGILRSSSFDYLLRFRSKF